MKIVLWIANESNQKALACKIHQQFPISGIITETKKGKRKITIKKIFNRIFDTFFVSSILRAWFGMKAFYENQYKHYPDVKILNVENVNSDEAYHFTKELNPDIIIVSGTRMVKKKLLSIKPSIGILNLHTGLSPYIKGGPNCTNWCIATKQWHLIGNTIMWIDEGIDTGNIITTDFAKFNGEESLLDVHIKVMEQGHALYIKAIDMLENGNKVNVPQVNIAHGTTYYNKQWTFKEKWALIQNFKQFKSIINSNITIELRKTIQVVETR